MSYWDLLSIIAWVGTCTQIPLSDWRRHVDDGLFMVVLHFWKNVPNARCWNFFLNGRWHSRTDPRCFLKYYIVQSSISNVSLSKQQLNAHIQESVVKKSSITKLKWKRINDENHTADKEHQCSLGADRCIAQSSLHHLLHGAAIYGIFAAICGYYNKNFMVIQLLSTFFAHSAYQSLAY